MRVKPMHSGTIAARMLKEMLARCFKGASTHAIFSFKARKQWPSYVCCDNHVVSHVLNNHVMSHVLGML
jgi:hypothetical protein